MFFPDRKYYKNDIYEILSVPMIRRKGAWDTGYREYEGNIYIFSNVGIPGRTGHDYNNYWDGDSFKWEAKTNSNITQPLIRKMLNPLTGQKIFLFTRTNDKDPFTYEGEVTALDYSDSIPVKITWKLLDNIHFPSGIDNLPISEGLSEGSKKQITINKFERNPLARRLCVEHYGAFCRICGFDFYKKYGELGFNFIHVHHLIPLSKINGEYILDPLKDLIPICPNCHSMIHRNKEGVSVETLKSLIKE